MRYTRLQVHAMWGRSQSPSNVWRNTRDELSHWVAHHSQQLDMVVKNPHSLSYQM